MLTSNLTDTEVQEQGLEVTEGDDEAKKRLTPQVFEQRAQVNSQQFSQRYLKVYVSFTVD